MSRQRDLLVNFERMWREMDELMDAPFARGRARRTRVQSGFSPRVDVFYCRAGEEPAAGGGSASTSGPPRAIVVAELAGVGIDSVSLEVSGRELVISGERAVERREGQVYQQLEIEAGPFRRVVELGAEVDADEARATYEDGILRVELPLRTASATTRTVPIGPGDG
jgi:HSP20 family protein